VTDAECFRCGWQQTFPDVRELSGKLVR
jgi:hypothetical protein